MIFNDVKSPTLDITCGVLQGSILGPQLFVFYLNDMDNVSTLFKLIVFADLTDLYCSNRPIWPTL